MEPNTNSSPAGAIVSNVQPATSLAVVEEKADINDNSVAEKSEVKVPESTGEVFYMTTQETGASLVSSVVNMMNSIVGAGVLSIPNTVKKAGIIGSFLLLSISLYLSLEGAHMLSASAVYTKEDSYGTIGQKLAKAWVGLVGDFAVILFDMGVSVAYLIIFFQQVIDLLHNWGHIALDVLATWKPLICGVLALLIAFPLLSIPTMDALRFTSSIALVCIFLFVVISVIKGIVQLAAGGLTYALFPRDWSLLPGAVSVFFTSMCCHVNIPKMTAELRFPSKSHFSDKTKKMKRVNNIAFWSCGFIYFFVGAFGYLAYGDAIGANLLDNFSQDQAWYLNIIKLAYAFVVLFSYPALSFAALVSFDKICFKKQPRPSWRRITEAFVWTVIASVIAIVIPELDTVFGITGSLCGILINFTIPAYFYICMAKKEKAKEQSSRLPMFTVSQGKISFSWFIFYLGVVADVVFTSLQLKDIIVSNSS